MSEAAVSLDLDAIEDPKFVLRFAGETKALDPFVVLEAIRAVNVDPSDERFLAQMDEARKAFGFPTDAAAKEANVPTPSVSQVLSLIDRFTTYLEKDVKPLGNLLGKTQSSSPGASIPSEPASCPAPTEPSSSAA